MDKRSSVSSTGSFELQQENERLRDALQRMERILEISRELTSLVALGPLLHRIVSLGAELTRSESASILLLDKRTGELRFRAASSDAAGRLSDIPVPVEGSIAGAVLLSGQPAVIADVRKDHRHYTGVGMQIGFETRSLLAVPMKIQQQPIGVLEAVNRREGDEFTEEDVEVLTALAAQAAVAIENARLVEELRAANERLGQLDRLKSDVIAIASHELRTPLSLILGYSALLRERLDDQTGPQLDVVLRSAMRLRQIIDTMINLRYLETGEVELACKPFDLREEVRAACEGYRSLAEANGVHLQMRVPESPVILCADQDKVRLVLDNLISNAVKFTPWDGHVQVTVTQRRNQAQIAVADTGIGIPQEQLERIFQPFEQVEEHMKRRYGGVGLGLSVVKGLVEQHGGRVWAESVQGRGSRFVVVLPVETR